MSKEELEATLDGEIGDDEMDEVSDDETYDFGVESERTMIQQTEEQSDLSFAREIFPKVFGSQWSEVIPQTKQPVFMEARTLLGMAMDNQLIDWSHGGQHLHLLYCLELLLHRLESRGWDIVVIFFDALPYDHAKDAEHRLAAEILKQHLLACSSTGKALRVREFAHWWHEDWRTFVSEEHPSFVVIDLPLVHVHDEAAELTYDDVQKVFLLDMLAQRIRVFSSDFRISSSVWSFDLTLRYSFSIGFLTSIHQQLESGSVFPSSTTALDQWPATIPSDLSRTSSILAFSLGTLLSEGSDRDLIQLFLLAVIVTHGVPFNTRLQPTESVLLPEADSDRIRKFLAQVSSQLYRGVQYCGAQQTFSLEDMVALADLVDGRLFYALYSQICATQDGKLASREKAGLDESSQSELDTLWKAIGAVSGAASDYYPLQLNTDAKSVVNYRKEQASTPVEDKDASRMVNVPQEFIEGMALEDVEGQIKEHDMLAHQDDYRTFVNDRSLLEELPYYHCDEPEEAPVEEAPEKRLTKRERNFRKKQRQKYYNFTEKVSESLSGKGKAVHHVVSARSDSVTLQSLEAEAAAQDQQEDKKKKGGKGAKGGKGGKPGAKGGKGKKGHINRKEQILAKNKERILQGDKDHVQTAINFASEEEKLKDRVWHLSKKLKALRSKTSDKALAAGYMQLIEWTLLMWRAEVAVVDDEEDLDDFEETDLDNRNYEGAIQTFRLAFDTVQLYTEHLSAADIRRIQHIFYVLGIKEAAKEIYKFYTLKHPDQEKEARYKPKKLTALEKAMSLGMSFAAFQLLHCGHLMQRSFDSKKDERVVGFHPDAWQRELLDVVDSNQSALVVAPTSSGKTFISYYTMKQVIEANKKAKYQSKAKLVVYVAPTKALVRQVAAEVYTHYGPIVGILTSSYEQSSESCQILVTVPQCLEELLLDPKWNANKIAYCILDEIHCIQEFGTGEQSLDEGGSIVWEHVINLLPCPFLALSATIGNPTCFRNWLAFSQQRYNRDVRIVTHKHRWADLKLQVYTPSAEDKSILDITETTQAPEKSSLSHLHPAASLTLTSLQESDSLHNLRLSPEECYQLYSVFLEAAPETHREELKALDPESYFKGLILRYEVFEYETKLKDMFIAWSRAEDTEKVETVAKVLDHLSGTVHAKDAEYPHSSQFCYEYFLSLLVELHNTDKLPALVFSLDRHRCNKLITDLVTRLEDMETQETQKPDYQRRLREYQKTLNKQQKKSKRSRDKVEKEAKHAADATEESAGEMELPGKDERFSFLRKGEGVHADDKEFWMRRLQPTNDFMRALISGLDRGIGVHHGALPPSYRTTVEVLFRAGHLKVVISTGTLSLGINMPCKTVVFAGDSHALTPLSFQQMSGRAGRRGYDDYGNIVFFGISQYRVFSLLGAQLTTLTGGQPITPTVTLRLLNCYYQTEAVERKAIAERLRGLLSPSLYSTNLEEKDAVVHRYHTRWLFRIYMDILIRLPLLELNSLYPTNIASLVMKLFNTEPSNLLISYFFLTASIDEISNSLSNQQDRLNDLLLVLCHIFRPIPVTPYMASFIKKDEDSNSLIVLPDLKPAHDALLKNFNQQILNQFVSCILSAHKIQETELGQSHILPFSRQSPQGARSQAQSPEDSLVGSLTQAAHKLIIRSPFVGLSGHNDQFQTGQELADTCNLSLPIELDQIPSQIMQDIRGRVLHLNAYAWDFLKHGNRKLLVDENGFKEANAWELIHDWDEILNKLKSYLSALPSSEDDRLKRVSQLFEFLHGEFNSRFEKFNN